jgi:hypothetical protein
MDRRNIGGIGRRIIVQGWPQEKNERPYQKNNAVKDWGHCSRGSVPI